MPRRARVRAWGARWRRLRLDGRLPEQVEQLALDVLRLRVGDLAGALVARVRPVAGTRGWSAPYGHAVHRAGRRRWLVGERLAVSHHDLAHEHATSVVRVLSEHGVECRAVEAEPGRGMVLAVDAGDRGRALAAMRAGLGGQRQPWYVEWRRGHRRQLSLVAVGGIRAGVRRADTWWVFAPAANGPGAILGRDEAAEVGFWERLPDGGWERLGRRGLDRFDVTATPTVEELDGRRYPGLSSAPLRRGTRRLEHPIDLVYTWVDGADPAWRQHYDDWRARLRPRSAAALPGRFRSRDELRYSLRSAWSNAGWFRHLYLVTAGHVPDWLAADDRIRIVEHAEIMPATSLPTFNSHAIEANLHRIPGLAEHFVYLNDDFFIGRPLPPTAFFTSNGLARVFEDDARIEGRFRGGDPRDVDIAARNGADLIERRFGLRIEHKLRHAPFALRRSMLVELENEFAEALHRTTESRFRASTDVSVASAFAHHYALCRGEAVLGSLRVDYANIEHRSLALHLERLLRGRRFDAFCLNETEQAAARPARVDERVARFLEAYFPHPAPWER